MNEIAQGHKNVGAVEEYAAKCDTLWPSETMKMYFNTNHDENSWNGTVQERMGDLGNAMYVLASMIQRSFPLIYSGQEAGLNHRYPFFTKDTVGIEWSSPHAQADFFAQMLALKHEHHALFNGELGYDMNLDIDTATNSMMIVRSKEGEEDIVAAVFEFSELPNPFDIPQNLDLVIDINGAQVWASKLD
jgi:hypothetical protein